MNGLSVSQRTTSQWSFEEDLVFLSQAGLDGIGLWRRKLLEVGEDKAFELLSESSLKPLYLDWTGGFTGSQGWSYRQAIEEAQRFIEFASRIRASVVILHSGARGRHTFNHSRRILRDAIKELVPVAKQYGVILALEPVHPKDPEELTYLQTIAETVEFITGANCDNVKFVCDLGHVGLDSAALEQIGNWVSHVCLVQLADLQVMDGHPVRVPLGSGVVPLNRVLTQLIKLGYKGPFDIEMWGPGVSSRQPHELIAQAREFFLRNFRPLLSEPA